jgi:hypothetical protein
MASDNSHKDTLNYLGDGLREVGLAKVKCLLDLVVVSEWGQL